MFSGDVLLFLGAHTLTSSFLYLYKYYMRCMYECIYGICNVKRLLHSWTISFCFCAYFFLLFFISKPYKQRLSFHILPAIRSKWTFIQMVFIDLVAALVIMHICSSKKIKRNKNKKLIAIYLSFRYSSHFIFWTISTNYRLYLNRFLCFYSGKRVVHGNLLWSN